MGVRGLLKYLKAHADPRQVESIERGSELVVDGNGYVFFFFDEYLKDLLRKCGSMKHALIMVDYKKIHELIIKQLHSWVNDYGLIVTFFFDDSSCASKFKSHTILERQKKRIEQWQSLCSHFNADGGSFISMQSVPLPSLLISVVKSAINCCGLRYELSADGVDADCFMTHRCSNSKSPRCFCLANDSDFVVMSGCAFIEFSDFHCSLVSSDDSDEIIAVAKGRVWRKDAVARALKLSPQQFADFCILMGNDFSNRYPRLEYIAQELIREVPHVLKQEKAALTSSQMEEVRRWFAGQTNPLRPRNAAVLQILSYARDFYNVELHKLRDHVLYPPEEHGESLPYFFALDTHAQNQFREFCDLMTVEKLFLLLPQCFGTAINELPILPAKLVLMFLMSEDVCGESTAEWELCGAEPFQWRFVTAEHVHALRSMLVGMAEMSASSASDLRFDTSCITALDLLVITAFEQLVRTLLRKYGNPWDTFFGSKKHGLRRVRLPLLLSVVHR